MAGSVVILVMTSRMAPLLLTGWTAALLCLGCGAPSPIRIGVALDVDGIRGATLAADEVNAAGGIDGRRLELRVMQGQSSTLARDALAAAQTLATDPGVLAVVGHTNSAASLAAAQVYNEQHVVQIAPNSSAPLYSSAGPYSFRLVASDVHQGTFLGALVAADSSRDRTAVLYTNDDYGRALHGTLAASLSVHDVTPVYEAPFDEGVRFDNAQAIAQAVARAHPALLVWIGRSQELIVLLPFLHAALPGIRVLASDGISSPQVERDPSTELIGIRYVRFLDLANVSPQAQRLAVHFRQQWGGESTDQYPLAYDAVRMLAEAMRARGAHRESIREYLAVLGTTRPPFPGVSGPIRFDPNGDTPPQYFVAEITAAGPKAVALPAGARATP
jgi:branched-chain amino acid transport system substrate-binding protein